MFNLVLTKSTTFIIGPISTVLGKIMEWLYNFFDLIGIANLGLCIIMFTVVIKMIMIPLTVKQQKFSKLSALMNPEIQAVQKKYKGKRDNESVARMQEETKAVYAKYGTSPTGGCLQLAIQMPILFALYNVIRSIPAYVPNIYKLYENIRNVLTDNYIINKLEITIKGENATDVTNKVIDKLAQFKTANWTELQSTLSESAVNVVQTSREQINQINSFLGINLSQSPWELIKAGVIFAIIIPILAGVAQWFSTKLMTNTSTGMSDDNPMASSMKTMTMTMPIITLIFCFTLPAGLGLYWVASSVFQVISQLIINSHFNKVDMNDIIKKNIEKANKKREKKGLPAHKVSSAATYNTRNIPQPKEVKKDSNDETVKTTSNEKVNVKSGSLASKAYMVKEYNDKNNKK